MAKTISLDLKDIRSVTDFQRNTKTHLARLHKTKAPMVLTVNGAASAVVLDASAFQGLMDRVEELEEEQRFIAAVNEGLADVEAGRVMPLDQAVALWEKKLGIRRQSR